MIRAKNPRAVEGGRVAKEVGDRFEQWIDGQHDAAKYLGILAHVHHNEPRVKVVSGRVIYEKATVADYTGVLVGGRALATETKSTKAGRFPLSDVTPKQQEHLEMTARGGGLALLVLEFREETVKHRFAIPWLDVPWEVERTAQAVYLSELKTSDWCAHPGCYLSRWHAGGPRVAPGRVAYPAE